MHGSGSAGPAERTGVTPRLPPFRRHALAFAVAALALIAGNVATGGRWWSLWILALWGIVLGAHYLAHKARTVDEAWVEERTDDVRSKSYDASHIDAIKKDAADKAG
jgi:hypothetical protein